VWSRAVPERSAGQGGGRARLVLACCWIACSHAGGLDNGPADARAAPDRALEIEVAAPDLGGASLEGSAHELCVAACAPAPRECPNADCVPNCEGMLGDSRCGTLARPLVVCEGQTSSSDYFCVDGAATLKATTCPEELRVWIRCIAGQPAKP
jgi:hypothetical protein